MGCYLPTVYGNHRENAGGRSGIMTTSVSEGVMEAPHAHVCVCVRAWWWLVVVLLLAAVVVVVACVCVCAGVHRWRVSTRSLTSFSCVPWRSGATWRW